MPQIRYISKSEADATYRREQCRSPDRTGNTEAQLVSKETSSAQSQAEDALFRRSSFHLPYSSTSASPSQKLMRCDIGS